MLFKYLSFLEPRQYDVQDNLIVQQLINELIHVNDAERALAIANAQLTVIVVERFQQLIDLNHAISYFLILLRQAQVH